MVSLKIKRLVPHAQIPRYMSAGAAGMDLVSAVEKTVVLQPGERALIPTGIAVELPTGYEAQVRPRSGLAIQHGVTVLNAPGTIDEDYRGEIKVALINHGQNSFSVEPGMRVAQLVVAPTTRVHVEVVANLVETARECGGFGSTGI